MDLLEIYKSKYSDEVMIYAKIYNAAATADAIARCQAVLESPPEPQPDFAKVTPLEWATWRPAPTPDEMAEDLHDRLWQIVVNGYAAQYTEEEMETLCKTLERGVWPVCEAEESSEATDDIAIKICEGCTVNTFDLKRACERANNEWYYG